MGCKVNHPNRCVHRTTVKKEVFDPSQKTLTDCYKKKPGKQSRAMLRRDEEARQAREHGSYVNPLRAKSDEAMMLSGFGGSPMSGPFSKGRKTPVT